MKQKSSKQKAIDYELTKIKKTMDKRCAICGKPANDLSHVLPRSLFIPYITNQSNLRILCRDCHKMFDDNKKFRSTQKELFEKVVNMINKSDRTKEQKEIDYYDSKRYFGL